MNDLIFVSLENWDDVWRRNQFICSTLSRRFPDMKILFVGLPRDVSHDIRLGKRDAVNTDSTWRVPNFSNVTVTRALKLLPNSLSVGRKINEWMARRHVRNVARKLGIKFPMLWLNPHSAVHMVGQMDESSVVYDITDDWAQAPSFSEAQRELISQQDRELCSRADLVIVCSEALQESRASQSKRIFLLPNGVDVAHYAQIAEPDDKGRWRRPVFGYTGTIHGDRFDVDLVAGLAHAFESGSVVLVGPDHLTGNERAKLSGMPNVHITGPVPYADIPKTMEQFDVCIVPHVETKFTNSLNPIKLWEYLASGKPVVSTNVAGFRSYPQFCRIASSVSDFVTACKEALGEKGALRAERRAEAEKHGWNQRVDALIERLVADRLLSA